MERLRSALPLVVLAGLGVWPFLYALNLWPESRDAVVWITRSAPSSAGWLAWCFGSEHFIGWRPVTAASFALDGLAGETRAWTYRATDLALHVACGLLVFAVYRRWRPDLPRWGALASAAVLLAHPVAGLVVPHLARRAYPLSCALALGALWVALGTVRRVPLVAALVTAAAAANETAFAAFPVVAWVLHTGVDRARWVRDAGMVAGAGAALVAVRLLVLGGLGGYRSGEGASFPAVVAALVEGLVGGAALRTDVGAWPLALSLGLAAVAAIGLADGGAPERTCGAWLGGLLVLVGLQGVYFPRQVYALLPAFSLLVGFAAARRTPRATAGIAAALAGVAWQSAVWRGPDPLQVGSWRAHDALVREMVADLEAVPEGAVVHAVIPAYRRPELEALRARGPEEERAAGRHAVTWVAHVTGASFGDVALVQIDPGEVGMASLVPAIRSPQERTPLSRSESGRAHVVVPIGRELSRVEGFRVNDDQGSAVLVPSGPGWLYVHDGARGTLEGPAR